MTKLDFTPSPRRNWFILAAVTTAILLLLLTQSKNLLNNLYMRYIDYKWNQVELVDYTINNELQDGFPDNWSSRTWNNGRSIIRKEADQVRSGKYAARVEKTSQGGVAALSQILPVPNGASAVSLRVFSKGQGGAAQIRFIFEGQTQAVNGGWQNIPSGGNWRQYRINKPLPDNVRLVEVLFRSNGRTFFDNAYLGFQMADGESLNVLKNPDFENDGVDQDPIDWWQEHTLLPDVASIPESALADRLPFLNILDMLNGRYENISRRINELETPCTFTPEMTSWLLTLAPKVEQKGGASAREKLYQLGIELAPGCPQPHGQLAQLYDEYGIFQSAADEFRIAAELAGDTPLAGYYYLYEGLMHVRHTGNLEQAIYSLEKAEQLEAWVTGIVFQGAPAFYLGLAYKNAGLFQESAASFQRVIDCDACPYYQKAAAAELVIVENQ